MRIGRGAFGPIFRSEWQVYRELVLSLCNSLDSTSTRVRIVSPLPPKLSFMDCLDI